MKEDVEISKDTFLLPGGPRLIFVDGNRFIAKKFAFDMSKTIFDQQCREVSSLRKFMWSVIGYKGSLYINSMTTSKNSIKQIMFASSSKKIVIFADTFPSDYKDFINLLQDVPPNMPYPYDCDLTNCLIIMHKAPSELKQNWRGPLFSINIEVTE